MVYTLRITQQLIKSVMTCVRNCLRYIQTFCKEMPYCEIMFFCRSVKMRLGCSLTHPTTHFDTRMRRQVGGVSQVQGKPQGWLAAAARCLNMALVVPRSRLFCFNISSIHKQSAIFLHSDVQLCCLHTFTLCK